MFDNYEDFFKKSDADIEELTYGQMMHALAGATGSTKHTHSYTHHHHTKYHHNAHHIHRTLDSPTPLAAKAPRLIDGNYYEWIEADKKWIKIIEDSPEPPSHWEPGLFDGEIRKYIPE